MQNKTTVAGNFYNKYESSNIISRMLMKKYFQAFNKQLTNINNPGTILEVGCGEGYITHRLALQYDFAHTYAIDISPHVIQEASIRCKGSNLFCASAEQLPFEDNYFDLVVCVETLEHLSYPHLALKELNRVGRRYILVSVPQEPVWRILNLARGAYIRQWGNTPGHIQHWTVNKFIEFLQTDVNILEVKTPLPWIMVLCEVKNGTS